MVDSRTSPAALFIRRLRLPFVLVMAVGAMTVAGMALVKTDEHLGTAHVPMEQVIAAHPEMAADPVDANYPNGAPPAFVATSASAQKAAPKPQPLPASPAPEVLEIKHTLPITDPIKYGQWFWNEKDAPASGPIVITVDLEARVLSIFRDGYEIGTTAVLLGTQEKPTPLGVFPITQKDQHHVSNLYDAPMPYMMRLTNDGVSIHATNVQNGYASHGCVGVPLGFAQKIFAAAKLGDRVIITRGGKTA